MCEGILSQYEGSLYNFLRSVENNESSSAIFFLRALTHKKDHNHFSCRSGLKLLIFISRVHLLFVPPLLFPASNASRSTDVYTTAMCVGT